MPKCKRSYLLRQEYRCREVDMASSAYRIHIQASGLCQRCDIRRQVCLSGLRWLRSRGSRQEQMVDGKPAVYAKTRVTGITNEQGRIVWNSANYVTLYNGLIYVAYGKNRLKVYQLLMVAHLDQIQTMAPNSKIRNTRE